MKNKSPLHVLKHTVPLPVMSKHDSWDKRASLLSLSAQVICSCFSVQDSEQVKKQYGFF